MIRIVTARGLDPVADEEPPRFPFCEACPPVVSARGNYLVDEDGHFDPFMAEEEVAESYRQSGDAAMAMAEQEGWLGDEHG
jgi:hypothetical protein